MQVTASELRMGDVLIEDGARYIVSAVKQQEDNTRIVVSGVGLHVVGAFGLHMVTTTDATVEIEKTG